MRIFFSTLARYGPHAMSVGGKTWAGINSRHTIANRLGSPPTPKQPGSLGETELKPTSPRLCMDHAPKPSIKPWRFSADRALGGVMGGSWSFLVVLFLVAVPATGLAQSGSDPFALDGETELVSDGEANNGGLVGEEIEGMVDVLAGSADLEYQANQAHEITEQIYTARIYSVGLGVLVFFVLLVLVWGVSSWWVRTSSLQWLFLIFGPTGSTVVYIVLISPTVRAKLARLPEQSLKAVLADPTLANPAFIESVKQVLSLKIAEESGLLELTLALLPAGAIIVTSFVLIIVVWWFSNHRVIRSP